MSTSVKTSTARVFLSSVIWKSSGFRSRTNAPLLSVTTASIST
jgi:hypothetical protein